MAADPDDAGECIRLQTAELPDCVDPDTPGQWYACDEPPTDQANLQCFQPEDPLPGCDEGSGEGGSQAASSASGKGWICIDTATAKMAAGDSEDGY